ncbi:HIT-like domain-containing protein, partial [Dissophora ornata]
DEEIATFYDINPAAETHILIVPVAHIENIKSLNTEHTGLLEKMRQRGIELLKDHGHEPEASKLGFHVPPFNTVDHLHLHVLGGAMKSNFRKLKYQTGRMWYMDLAQLQADLAKQQRPQGARL